MGPKTLSIDVGGSGIKGMVLDAKGQPLNDRERITTPKHADAKAVLKVIGKLIALQPEYDRVSVGFPGVVVAGITHSAPNLDGNWHGVPLAERVAELAGKPCRAVNDADMQGYGAVEGHGVEMMVTLGTGLGSAIFTNGHLVPNLELGHHPFEKRKTYEQRLGDKERRKIGNKKWSQRVLRAIGIMLPIWNPRVLYLGGGNTKKLTLEMPGGVQPVDNIAGIIGGVRLWDDEEH
ncbi:MAG: ROK family protein [Gammaproteobacteria bacterium]|nr:ROK family protein [Gammaproteobacteria bacterium]NNF61225.1 ROK family protein [Gammaproteobacteria bacterium]NNM20811.1 ROK family protein [Gammaproteobacteria bacterium]